jgi:septum formation protein
MTSDNAANPVLTPFVPWPENEVLVLASKSPRRAQLLGVAGIPFEQVPAGDIEADLAAVLLKEQTPPQRYAELLARAKAQDVAGKMPGRLVLGSDTVVVLDGDILEKPMDVEDAVALLTRLSGRRHTVISSLALEGGKTGSGFLTHEKTTVEFLPLDEDTIRKYVATGEPMDKAGAYGIQGYGAMMVRGVDGCYFNVMGLPLARLGGILRQVFSASIK